MCNGTWVLELEVWSDIACPWCWLGHRRLGVALEGADDVVVRHRAFELSPDMPVEGRSAEEHYTSKFGSLDAIRPAQARIAALGAEIGVPFAFERVVRAPNTRVGHRLVKIAAARGASEVVALDALFAAHFSLGADISDPEVAALTVSAVTEIPAAELLDALAADEATAEVVFDEQRAGQLGITGVPLFLVAAAGNLGLSGAQDVEVLQQLLDVSRERIAA